MPSVKAPRERPIGRDDDAAAVRALLLDPAAACVTLTGPGGVGKRTLARFVGAERTMHAYRGDAGARVAGSSRS